MNADDFNDWRERYDSMSVADQRQFYSRVWTEYPDQRHHDPDAAIAFFASIPPRLRVQEIGGWQGHLAKRILENYPARSWDNYEICKEAVENSVVDSRTYRALTINSWPWGQDNHRYDVLVMTHCLEHMRFHEFVLLLASGNWGWIFLESPLALGPTDWTDYMGTHIFEQGWESVLTALRVQAYEIVEERRLGDQHGVVWARRP